MYNIKFIVYRSAIILILNMICQYIFIKKTLFKTFKIITPLFICLLLFSFLPQAYGVEEKLAAQPDLSIPISDKLSMKHFATLVKEKNENINIIYMEYMISRELVKWETNIFEPILINTYFAKADKHRYTLEEAGSNFVEGYDSKGNTYLAELELKIPTGATILLDYTIGQARYEKHDSLQNELSNTGDEYRSLVAVKFKQPLLKGSGMAVDANIRIAEAEADVKFQEYRQELMLGVFEALKACWDFYGAKEKYNIRKESVNIAEKILTDNQQRVKLGKMAETEVMEAEVGLDKRISMAIEAKQNYIVAMNKMRTFISSSEFKRGIEIDFEAYLDKKTGQPDFSAGMEKALKLRPEYVTVYKKIAKQDIKIIHAKNQRWPQLDLTGTYGFNGLGNTMKESWEDTFDGDFRKWSVGFKLTTPLYGGIKTKSNLNMARYKKKQALLELKKVEVEIANDVDTAIGNVHSTREQVRHYENARDLKQKLFDIELERLATGKSNSLLVLEKEEQLNVEKVSTLDSFTSYKKALLQLDAAEGSILQNYDVEGKEMAN